MGVGILVRLQSNRLVSNYLVVDTNKKTETGMRGIRQKENGKVVYSLFVCDQRSVIRN